MVKKDYYNVRLTLRVLLLNNSFTCWLCMSGHPGLTYI